MKTILVIQENKQQVVLTPENDYEKNILKLIESQKVKTTMKVGKFSDCQGGWIRYYDFDDRFNQNKFDSLMVVLENDKEPSKAIPVDMG